MIFFPSAIRHLEKRVQHQKVPTTTHLKLPFAFMVSTKKLRTSQPFVFSLSVRPAQVLPPGNLAPRPRVVMAIGDDEQTHRGAAASELPDGRGDAGCGARHPASRRARREYARRELRVSASAVAMLRDDDDN